MSSASACLALLVPCSYRWAFVPEVDTEHPAFLSELEENHQECRPHTVRILELLRSKYGVSAFLLKTTSIGPEM